MYAAYSAGTTETKTEWDKGEGVGRTQREQERDPGFTTEPVAESAASGIAQELLLADRTEGSLAVRGQLAAWLEARVEPEARKLPVPRFNWLELGFEPR